MSWASPHTVHVAVNAQDTGAGARTHDVAAVAGEISHVGGHARGVDPVAAVEGHDGEAHDRNVWQPHPLRGRQPEAEVAAEVLQQADGQHQPGSAGRRQQSCGLTPACSPLP